jgi:hypothetical protein
VSEGSGVTDVRDISRLAYWFMASKALFVAHDLDLFTHLAQGRSADCVRSQGVNCMSATARRTALILLVVACAIGATATAATAATDEPTTVHVEGTQTQVSADHYQSYGGLLGDLWILTFDPLYESDSLVVGTGTERLWAAWTRTSTEPVPRVSRPGSCGLTSSSG